MVAGSTTSALAIVFVDVLGSVHNFVAGGAYYIVSAVAIINNILYTFMVASVAADTFTSILVESTRFNSPILDLAIGIMECDRMVSRVKHIIVKIAYIDRKGCRSHSKHHSTCYNKRQHTAYFFKFHKPNLLYKNNTVYFSINAVLCCATMHGRQGTLFPETT